MKIERLNEPTVFLPNELENSNYSGELYGVYQKRTDIFNIFYWKDIAHNYFKPLDIKLIGEILSPNESIVNNKKNYIIGQRENGKLSFSSNGNNYKKLYYSLIQDIFSRNSGILESDWMLNKKVIISGCGSVGSLIAIELAKAGIGNFLLIDNDILYFHNICRHQCDLEDVGNYKTNALERKIKKINPFASVETYLGIVEDVPKKIFDKYSPSETVIVSCADNRFADKYACKISSIMHMPFVSIGFWDRAFAGEIFYYLPGTGMPCYECAFGEIDEMSGRQSVSRRLYTTQENLLELKYEPGISIDIDFVTIIGLKLILDIINIDNKKFTPRVLDYLSQFTLVCNTNNKIIGGDLAEIFSYPLQVTNSISVKFGKNCPPCLHES